MPQPPGSPREQFEILERGIPLRTVATAPKPKPGVTTLFAVLNGGGKVELYAQHPTGAAQLVSTEP